MKYVLVKGFDIPDASDKTLRAIWTEGEDFKVGYGSEETETKKLNLTIVIDHPENRPLLSDKAPNDQKYLNWYAGVYLWCPEKDDAEYTYGNRMHEQILEVIKRFKEEKMDRQCTVIIRRESDIIKGKCKDPPCLTMLDFEIIDDELCTTCYFRSWDAYAGLPLNIAGLQMVFEFMASEIGVKTGKMILHSKNCHIYKRVYSLVDELLNPKLKNHKI